MAINKRTALQKREDSAMNDESAHKHYPVMSNSLKIKLDHLKTFEALTDNQQLFFDTYKRGDYFIGLLGSPGVGKTFLGLYRAIEEVLDKQNSFESVVVVRSAVQVRDQGFVPGSLDEKMEIYEQPYREISDTLFGRKDAWDRLKEQGYARFISTTAIRGISIDNSIILVDECQSMTFHELSSVISRVGHRSKIIFIGDLKQNDLIKSRNDISGLSEFLNVARHMDEFSEITFTPDDIVRSSLVKSWIIACDKMGI
jgi:phosphate starvation-inducible protein PhoH and related proteins